METTYKDTVENDDLELMQGLLERDPSALERLHQRYHALLRSVIMQVLYDPVEADDVLQEVFLQIWDRAENYSSEKGKLASWLCTLARRRAIDRVRQHTAYRRATDRYEVSCTHTDQEQIATHSVERDVHQNELRGFLQAHLDSLPPSQEQAIRMAFLEDRSQREISVLTKTPLGTVKTRIELGIKKLNHAVAGLRSEMA